MTDRISDNFDDNNISTLAKVVEKMKKKPLCGKIIKTYDNSRLPCLRQQGHEGGCNPFSDTPYLGEKKKEG